MAIESSDNKRIAKNTLFLYLRMFLSMAIAFFTGRVVLRTLGVVDYGINNVVCGSLGLFTFIQTAMAGSSARFITYAIGKGDKESVRDTFCSAMNIHIIIAIVLFIIGETFGLWFVNTMLVIPEERMWVANVIYQFSILSLMLSVTQTPYGACIIAHEKMNIYAYMTILSSVLRLLIVYILVIGLMDKLLLYGILTFCVGVFMIMLYRIYCIRHFEESRFRFVWKPEIIKPMLSFSGWDLFGNVAVMGRGTGVDMLINIFFGPAVNAARGVSAHVSSVINQFSSNIIVAVRPQLIKRYASGDHEAMFELMSEGSRFCFILLSFFTIPLIAEMNFVFHLWLGNVPQYAVEFCIFELLFVMVGTFSSVIMIIIHATGKIKNTSIINGSIYIMVIPISYIGFKLGSPVWLPFMYNTFTVFCTMLIGTYLISRYVPSFPMYRFLRKDVFPCVVMYTSVTGFVWWCRQYMEEGWIRLFLSISLSSVLIFIISYYFLLSKEMKAKALSIIKKKISVFSFLKMKE